MYLLTPQSCPLTKGRGPSGVGTRAGGRYCASLLSVVLSQVQEALVGGGQQPGLSHELAVGSVLSFVLLLAPNLLLTSPDQALPRCEGQVLGGLL